MALPKKKVRFLRQRSVSLIIIGLSFKWIYVHEQCRLPYSFVNHMEWEQRPHKVRSGCHLIGHTLSKTHTYD